MQIYGQTFYKDRYYQIKPTNNLNNDIMLILLKTLPFWPETDSMRMFVKLRDGKSGSQHFSIIKEEQTVLRMDKGVKLIIRKLYKFR